MFRALLPKDGFFFDKFDRIAEGTLAAVNILVRMVEKKSDFAEDAIQIKTLEHQTDQIVHDIHAQLHKTFITPLDREVIRKVASRLDDILDLIESASSRIDLYRPVEIPPETIALCNVLRESVKLMAEMVNLLRNLKQHVRIMTLTVEIHRLEDEADHIRRGTLARLFREEKDPIELIKWKDILGYIESATDRCDDVAGLTEGIVVENQ